MLIIALLLICGIGAYIGYRRGLLKATARTVGLVVSALLTLLIVGVLLKPSLLETVKSALLSAQPTTGAAGEGTSEISELMAIPSANFFLSALLASVFALIIYFPIYFIVNKLMLIPHHFIAKAIDEKQPFADKISAPVSKWTGLAVGIIGALVTYALFTMPLCGVSEMLRNASTESLEAVAGDEAQYVDQIGEFVGSSASLTETVIYRPFVRGTFDAVTTYNYDGENGKATFNMNSEVAGMAKLLNAIPYEEDGSTNEDTVTSEDRQALSGVADVMEELEKEERMTAKVISDIITKAASDFHGTGKFLNFDLSDEIKDNPAVKKLLEILMDDSVAASAKIRNGIDIADSIFNIADTLKYVVSDEFDVNNTEAVKKMLQSVNKVDPDVTLELIDSVLCQSDKFGDTDANKLVAPISEVFEIIATSEFTEQEFETEASAINNVLNCVLNANDISGEAEAERIVDSILDSKALSAAINKLNSENAIDSVTISESSAKQLAEILNKYEGQSSDATQKQTIDAIRSFFGLN